MISNNVNKELLNDIELEMKSNNNTNSDIISIDDIPKKEIISDSYTEIKFIKNEKNNDNENNDNDNDNNNKKENISEKNNDNSSTKDDKSNKEKDIFCDLTFIIKDKIRTRNIKENNKKKKIRLLSAPSTDTKNKNLFNNLNPPSTTTSKKAQILYNPKLNKTKDNSSVPKNNNVKNIKKSKKNPELFINKKNNNYENNKNENIGNLTTKRD